jgi:hypothetical protein
MEKQLEVIVIPSGENISDDSIRLSTAQAHGINSENEGREVRYILSGVGPDLDKRLKQERDTQIYIGPFDGTHGLDVHPELYSQSVEDVRLTFLIGDGFKPVGIDTASVNSVQNMINTFPRGTEGDYTIVSRALHNARFKLIEKEARKRGYFSDKLQLSYLNTPDSFSPKNIAHDLMGLAKFWVLGKVEIKNYIPA